MAYLWSHVHVCARVLFPPSPIFRLSLSSLPGSISQTGTKRFFQGEQREVACVAMSITGETQGLSTEPESMTPDGANGYCGPVASYSRLNWLLWACRVLLSISMVTVGLWRITLSSYTHLSRGGSLSLIVKSSNTRTGDEDKITSWALSWTKTWNSLSI